MSVKRLTALAMIALLMSVTIVTLAATAQPTGDEYMNADRGPSDEGPPGFVADLVPDFIGELIGGLPVPNFVKHFFGAPTC
jgi:hypothetical protein